MGFDLAEFSGLDAAECVVEIDNPKTAEPTGLKITVAGSLGELARLGQRVLAHKMREAKQKGIDLEVLDNDELDFTDPRVMEAQRITSAALTGMMKPRIKGWSGMLWNGEELPFTTENVKLIFDNPAFFWLANQIYVKAETQANFTKASSKTSAKRSKTT